MHQCPVTRLRPVAVYRHRPIPKVLQAHSRVVVPADQNGPVVAGLATVDAAIQNAEHLDPTTQFVDDLVAADLSDEQVRMGPQVLRSVRPPDAFRGVDTGIPESPVNGRPQGIDCTVDLRPVVHG